MKLMLYGMHQRFQKTALRYALFIKPAQRTLHGRERRNVRRNNGSLFIWLVFNVKK